MHRCKLRLITAAALLLSLGCSPVLQAAPASSSSMPNANVQLFTTVLGDIKNFYVEPVKDQQLFEDAISGMLQGLDPHSSFLNKADYLALQDLTTGEFAGIGLEVTMDHGYIKVISPLDGSPSEKAGLKPGDYIIRINNKPVSDMSLQDAVNIMRGEKGTPLTLTIYRESDKKLKNIKLIRSNIVIQSVSDRLYDQHFAYIRISSFQEPTAKEVKTKLLQLQSLKGVVIDLRNNPGGLLDSAVDVSNLFLDSKKLGKNTLIVYTKGRLPDAQIQAHADGSDILHGLPLIILINNGSASASEIVAGALQDHKRAVIIGTPSFGKGSVQTVIPLPGDRAIKLTTALYYTPDGHSIQAKGIQPDVLIKEITLAPTKEDSIAAFFENLKEQDLKGHLANGDKATAQNDSSKTENYAGNISSADLINTDFQLYEALTMLKGISIAQATPQSAP